MRRAVAVVVVGGGGQVRNRDRHLLAGFVNERKKK